MNPKTFRVTGSEPDFDFLDVIFKTSEFLYAKRTGTIVGLAFIDREGELVIQFDTIQEALEAMAEIEKKVK